MLSQVTSNSILFFDILLNVIYKKNIKVPLRQHGILLIGPWEQTSVKF